MGMFDTLFDNDAKITCPKCEKAHNVENGVQSKQFDKTLNTYEIGDVVDVNIDVKCLEDWDWCEYCKQQQIPVFFGFKNSIFTGIYQTEKEARKSSKKFNIMDYYVKQFNGKVKYKEKAYQLESRIKETIDVHGTEPTKNNFNMFYSLHHRFIDYDIIQTLKNILKYD